MNASSALSCQLTQNLTFQTGFLFTLLVTLNPSKKEKNHRSLYRSNCFNLYQLRWSFLSLPLFSSHSFLFFSFGIALFGAGFSVLFSLYICSNSNFLRNDDARDVCVVWYCAFVLPSRSNLNKWCWFWYLIQRIGAIFLLFWSHFVPSYRWKQQRRDSIKPIWKTKQEPKKKFPQNTNYNNPIAVWVCLLLLFFVTFNLNHKFCKP